MPDPSSTPNPEFDQDAEVQSAPPVDIVGPSMAGQLDRRWVLDKTTTQLDATRRKHARVGARTAEPSWTRNAKGSKTRVESGIRLARWLDIPLHGGVAQRMLLIPVSGEDEAEGRVREQGW